MFKHIIVPVDHAARPARRLAVAVQNLGPGGRITLLHVITQMPGYLAPELHTTIYSRAGDEADEALRALIERDRLPENTQVSVVRGSIHRKILGAVSDPNDEAIVMASHNPTFSDFLIGSVAAQVVKHAHCSVFVVRHAD
ncbi:MAG: universal stress protein [Burkholderiaceae bacterium]